MIKHMMSAAVVAVALGQAAFAADSEHVAKADKMLTQQTTARHWGTDYTGEQFAWNTNYSMRSFLRSYESTHDAAYLDAGVKFYDALIGKMATGPDGYKGWIGPFIYKNEYWCDVHVGDAILLDSILDFAWHVWQDPKLKEKYGAKAMEYVNLAKRDFFEKWDARGTYKTDGPYGFYVQWNKYGKPGQLQNWQEEEACKTQSGMSLPFNKQIDCGAVALRIWQITGEEKYKKRAEELYGFMKSRMFKYEGAYHWNYWEPAGQHDLGIDAATMHKGTWDAVVAKETMRHWTAVHPHRNYQSGEITNIVKAYDAGIVFTDADIHGMIQTNLKVMWNGDEKNPLFANSNTDLIKKIGEKEEYHGKNSGHAGELWSGLAPFDATIAKLAGAREPDRTPKVERREAKGNVEIPKVYAQFPLGNVRTVNMAAVMPSHFPAGDDVVIACKLIEPGDLQVALHSADGKERLAILKHGDNAFGGRDGREGIHYFFWSGSDPTTGRPYEPGDYRIRWTVKNDGYREFPIKILPEKK
jgi:hypothetical protein